MRQERQLAVCEAPEEQPGGVASGEHALKSLHPLLDPACKQTASTSGSRSCQMVSPQRPPRGDHVADGLFSRGCGSLVAGEKGLAGARLHWSQ